MVQFIVVSRGSERVAEVAARFTLDAVPGAGGADRGGLGSETGVEMIHQPLNGIAVIARRW